MPFLMNVSSAVFDVNDTLTNQSIGTSAVSMDIERIMYAHATGK
jgi:hypothetical protein